MTRATFNTFLESLLLITLQWPSAIQEQWAPKHAGNTRVNVLLRCCSNQRSYHFHTPAEACNVDSSKWVGSSSGQAKEAMSMAVHI